MNEKHPPQSGHRDRRPGGQQQGGQQQNAPPQSRGPLMEFKTLVEGQKINFEIEQDRRTGKSSAGSLSKAA